MTDDDYASVVLVLLLCILAVVALTGCSTDQWRVGFHAANAADAYTTVDGLNRGCVEASPLTGSNPSNQTVVAIALAQSVLAELVCRHAGDSEKVCWQVFTGIKLAAGAWNAAQSCE